MQGFKSFAKKTEILFGDKFNCVLGPNGSGKSNIVDAMSFVLGKISAKGMRAERSANLIYNGGKKGSPAKLAEVSITFSNDKGEFPIDRKEVTITRTVKQNGQSTYRINKEVRTRQQVVDLLNKAKIDPNGHNIILQGDIVHFTSMRPDERREIVEEISGISVFEEKKGRAMSELNKVQDRLNEAGIILTEREKTMKELKTDRDQALQYKNVEVDLKRSKATRLNMLINKKDETVQELDKRLNKAQQDIDRMQASIDEAKKKVGGHEKEIESISKSLGEKGDEKQRELGAEIEIIKTEAIRLNSRMDVVNDELRKLTENKKQLSMGMADASLEISRLEQKKKGHEVERMRLESRVDRTVTKLSLSKDKFGVSGVGELNRKLEEVDVAREKKREQMQSTKERLSSIVLEKGQLEIEMKACNAELQKLEDAMQKNVEDMNRLKMLKKEFGEVAKKLSSALNENSMLSAQLGEKRKKVGLLQEDLNKLKAKEMSAKVFSAEQRAIRIILSSKIRGVQGTVAQLGKTGSKHALALEVAAGARIKSIVVSNDAVAARCISLLKEKKAGVVTFLPLNKMKERVIDGQSMKVAKMKGSHGFALNLVRFDPKLKNVFRYIFGSTVVVDDLATARKIGVGRARMVTLDGDLLEASGAMVGGFRQRGSGFSFREEGLGSSIRNYESDIKKLGTIISELEKKRAKNDEDVIRLRERKAVLESQITSLEEKGGTLKETGVKGDVKKMSQQITDLDLGAKNCEKDIEAFKAEIESALKERSEIKEVVMETSGASAAAEMEKAEAERRDIIEKKHERESEVKLIDQKVGILKADLEKSQEKQALIKKDSERFSQELSELKEKLKGYNSELKEKERMQKGFYKEYHSLFNKRERMKDRINKEEGSVIRFEEKIRSSEQRANDLKVRRAELLGELEGLKREFEEFEGVQLKRNLKLEQLNADIRNLEQSIKDMGSINMRALDVYEKASKEYDRLQDKYRKLKTEKEDVLSMMYEIESSKKQVFMKAYKNLNKYFKEIFLTLSTKGEATLILENEENPFEGGVGIVVRIAQKKYLDIKSLSGGEKTMAALAFIFAIQEFKPAHFYLLDEVDAALDKRNSELLSKLIEKYAQRAQYLVISHNDSIITEAERIYGVSMQDGISKVVCLKI